MSGSSSLKILSKAFNIQNSGSNIGIGGSANSNIKLTIINNPSSWKNTIFRNSSNSDYISIGLYDFNNNNNTYIASIDKFTDTFKDLYINNLGISSQPSSLIGNVIINGKTTIGNSSNSIDNNFILDVYSKTSNNLAIFRNSNSSLFFNVSSNSNFNINTSTNRLFINGNTIFNGNIIISNPNNIINNDFINSNNFSLYIASNLVVNGILYGNASGLNNIKYSSINFDNNKINANLLNIDSNSPIIYNSNYELLLNFDTSKFQIINNNQLSIKNTALSSGNSYWYSYDPTIEDPTSVERIYYNIGDSYVGIKNDNPKSSLYVGENGNLLRLATIKRISDSYYSQISTNDNLSNINNTKIKLIAPVDQQIIITSNNYDISGSIYYYITGSNPIHSFNYESNNINVSLMTINKDGALYINPKNKSNNISEKLVVCGNVSILNSNSTNPAKLIIGESLTNNSILQTFGTIIIGNVNNDGNFYSLYANDNVKFNNNLNVGNNLTIINNALINGTLNVGVNLNVAGTIFGNGLGLTNINHSSIIYNSKINANNIKINSPLITNNNNELILNFDTSKFSINSSNQLSLNNSGIASYWISGIVNEMNPDIVSKIYFNNNESYVGIFNDNPQSYLYVGKNGNLLRLATANTAHSYYSQIVANDNNSNNINNTKIKLINPINQQLITSSNNYDISGSIYYYITGSNPVHSFNYEDNGINKSLMVLNKDGTLFLNSNNINVNNNEKLIVSGNVSILNSNINNPARVIIGESLTNNSILQTFGSIIIGNSNYDSSLYALYVNDNVKINNNLIVEKNLTINNNSFINNNLTINNDLFVNGKITGSGFGLTNINHSSIIYNTKINANNIKIDSNTPLNTNNNNELFLNFDISKFSINSNNQLSLNNSGLVSYWLSAIPNISDPDVVTKIYFNKSDSYVGILNDYPKSALYVGQNGNLLRLATPNVIDSYYSQISTIDNNCNINNTKIKLVSHINQQLITTSNNYDIAGSIYYYITGSNPVHAFNYESNGIINSLMVLNKDGTLFINSNNRSVNNNEKLIVSGNVSILNSNTSNPARVIIGENTTNNSILQTFGSIISGTSNQEASLYSFYANSNVKFNNNLIIGNNINVSNNLTINSNLFVGNNFNVNSNGVITGNGSNINNLKISSLYLDNSNLRLNANFININSNTGLNTCNNQLIINYDNTKFMITSNNQLSLSNSAIPSYWLSAIPNIEPQDATRIYFNKNDSYVGILNDYPKSALYIGQNGNLLRLATPNVFDSYYSQISTIDNNTNINNTKIKLVSHINQQLISSSNNYDIAGSIYYYITGSNPIHAFNYESNGIINSLMVLTKDGTLFINSNNRTLNNNEKLIVSGNVSILNSNTSNPARVIIGENTTNNSILQTFGSIISGTSNQEALLYSFYANSNVKFNNNLIIGNNINVSNNLTINSNLFVGNNFNVNSNGVITGNGSNINNLKISSLYLDNSNLRLNANFININSNTGLNTCNNQLIINYDNTKFMITSNNQLSLSNSAVPSYWLSAIPNIEPQDATRIYFNKNDSYVGILNDYPKSALYIGQNGNLLRLATPNVLDSYYSQISTIDNNTNINNTKIKLVSHINQQLISSSNNYDIAGSIYYYITGSNPIHAFNYESNGIINSLMVLNKDGTLFINSNNRSVNNNEKLIVSGNVSILNSNTSNPARVIIGENTTNNSILQTFGSIISGTSNQEALLYSFYANSNVKFNNNLIIGNNINVSNNLTINSNLFIGNNFNVNSNGVITGNGSNINNLKISSLYLDNSNLRLNANFININSNTGLNTCNNQLIINYDNTKFMITSNNQLSLSNSAVPSYWLSAIPNIEPQDATRIYFNKNDSYVGILNDYPKSALYIGQNGNLLRLATPNVLDSYYSQISTIDNNTNINNTKIKLVSHINQQLISSSNNYDIAGSIYYYITGSNPIHAFNYESNGIINSLMVLNKDGTLFINSNNRSVNNNEKLIVSGNVSILNSNTSNPARVIIGENTTNNSILQTFGSIISGTSNQEALLYSFYANSNVKFNNNLIIGNNINVSNNLTINSNLFVGNNFNVNSNGVITGNGSNINNLKISSLYLDNSNLRLNANFININSNTGLNTCNNQLIINYDNTKFMITSNNQLSLSNSAVPSYWLSAIPNIEPQDATRIYFNKNDSYVGILNDYPKSALYIGQNGNLLRLATPNVLDSYYSQISTIDNNTNINNTKIKLVSHINQQLISSSNNYDIAGSIYYYITGSNPIHAFNYESNGIINSLMVLNKDGTLFINSNNRSVNNNEKLIVSGNVSILNSNTSNPARVIIGENTTNNSILQTFGSIISGTSNQEALLYSFYANSNVKFNNNLIIGNNINVSNNLTINSNLFVGNNFNVNSNGVITGNGSNINNLKISSLYLDNSNLRLNANFININSNTGLSTSNNQLIINYDNTKFMITSNNQLSLSNSAIPSYWVSGIPGVFDANNVSRLYFNKNESYVGILNDNPLSYLYVGQNGNLLRLATPNIAHSYYSQIATNDNSSNNINNTKIKLINPINQQLITSSNNYDISGSIYYYITGSNPVHAFNYESNGIINSLMVLNKDGTLFINSNNRSINNNEKLIVSGNVSILNSNTANPARVIIGESSTSNSILQTFGSIISGESNQEASLYSFYANNNVKFNSNLIVVGSILTSNQANFANTVSMGNIQSSMDLLNDSSYILKVSGKIGLNGTISTISDERLKTNIRTYDNALDKILNCRGVSFNYNQNFYNNENDYKKTNIGVIAQEIEKILPELVDKTDNGYKNVNYLGIIGVLIEAIKELNNKIENKYL